jgi:hypothetical protein
MKRAIGIAAVSVLALAACGKKTDTAASAGANGTAATAVASAPAAPQAPPSRKSGLWTQTITSDAMNRTMNQTMKMCLDAAADQKMKFWGSSQAGKSTDCTEQRVTPHLGGGWDFHSVCQMGESGTITSDGSATGDFNSHYKVEVTAVTAGSPMAQANGTHKMSIEATWNGPCPADMKPGDMELPGGMRINATTGGMSGGPAGMHAGGHMTSADIAKLRAEAMAMAKAQHEQEK